MILKCNFMRMIFLTYVIFFVFIFNCYAETAKEYVNNGIAFSNRGDLAQAISDFTKAIEIDPHYADAYYHRAVVYYALKDTDNAWKDVHKAEEAGLSVDSNFMTALKNVSDNSQELIKLSRIYLQSTNKLYFYGMRQLFKKDIKDSKEAIGWDPSFFNTYEPDSIMYSPGFWVGVGQPEYLKNKYRVSWFYAEGCQKIVEKDTGKFVWVYNKNNPCQGGNSVNVILNNKLQPERVDINEVPFSFYYANHAPQGMFTRLGIFKYYDPDDKLIYPENIFTQAELTYQSKICEKK